MLYNYIEQFSKLCNLYNLKGYLVLLHRKRTRARRLGKWIGLRKVLQG